MPYIKSEKQKPRGWSAGKIAATVLGAGLVGLGAAAYLGSKRKKVDSNEPIQMEDISDVMKNRKRKRHPFDENYYGLPSEFRPKDPSFTDAYSYPKRPGTYFDL